MHQKCKSEKPLRTCRRCHFQAPEAPLQTPGQAARTEVCLPQRARVGGLSRAGDLWEPF